MEKGQEHPKRGGSRITSGWRKVTQGKPFRARRKVKSNKRGAREKGKRATKEELEKDLYQHAK